MGNPPESSPDIRKSDAAANPTGYPAMHDNNASQSQQMHPPPPPNAYPPPYPNQYPYQPPPGVYPYPQPYYYQHQHSKRTIVNDSDFRGAAAFCRVLLILTLCAIVSMMMLSLIIWLFFGASVPDFEIASMSVSNFSATNTTLTGIWSIAMWVSNANMKVDVHFQRGMSSVFYKNSLLGITAMDPFGVHKSERYALNFTVPALRTLDDQRLQSWVLPSLAADRSHGAVSFSVGMAVDANFTAPDSEYRGESLRILCEEMEIKLTWSSTTGTAAWSSGSGIPCFIRLYGGDRVDPD